jgi:hypothetical protein
MNHLRGETCKKGRETGEEGACVPRFWQFGEQQFGFRVVFIGPQVFKTKDANDSEGLGYGLLVTAGLWSMCWSLCPYESVTPNACSWRSLILEFAEECANVQPAPSLTVIIKSQGQGNPKKVEFVGSRSWMFRQCALNVD